MRTPAKDLDSLERLDRGVVARRTAEALEDLLRHAIAHVPHYRKALSASGVTSARSLHAEDIVRFPVLSREDVRQGMETGKLLARGVPWHRRVVTKSSGTTGAPLRLYGDTHSRRMRRQGWQLLDRWAGIRPGDQLVRMMVPRPRPTWSPGQPIRSLRKIVRFRQPADLISILKLTAEDVPRIVRALEAKVGPYHIYGFSSAIRFIAETAAAEGLRLSHSPRVVVGTSDTFTAEHRETVSAFLGCPAYSRYGSHETGGGVAQTCPDNPQVHHVLSDLVVAEVVDDDSQPVAPGEAGRLLLTDLTNHVMPLIRYDIGDVARAAEDCPCGRPWPVVGEFFGRTADRIVLDNGESRPAYELELTLFFYHPDLTKDLVEYQFVQHGPGELELRFVPRKPLSNGKVQRLGEILVHALLDRARVDVTAVERIERGISGKRRLVIQGDKEESMLTTPHSNGVRL